MNADHLQFMADTRPDGLDRSAARWALAEIERLKERIYRMETQSIDVEKMLCKLLDKPWHPAEMSATTLVEDIRIAMCDLTINVQDHYDLEAAYRSVCLYNERRLTALENIALLDEADGHELTADHALKAVGIATSALGKHPSVIAAERYALAQSSAS